jgi:hypothetical protein
MIISIEWTPAEILSFLDTAPDLKQKKEVTV